jgi:nickel/cobalt exporter
MVETEPVALRNAPEACRFVFRQPQELDPSTAMTLSQIPAEVRDLPPELLGLTQGLANTIVVRCGDVPVEDEAEVTEVNAPTPSASPFGVGPAPQPTINSGGPLAGYFAWVAGQQAQLYRWMADTVEQVRNAPGAGLILLFASFLYGVVHAAGPGHGKVVIGAYALATRQTARRAAIIALAAAFAQAVTAIVLIGMATGVFRAASSTVTTAAGWLELASYALIMGLGLWLSLRAVRRWMITKTSQDIGPEASPGIGPERSRQPASLSAAAAQSMVTGTQGEAGAGPADGKLSPDHADHAHAHEHAHHDHDHDHDCGDPSCGHSHLPKAKTLQGDFSLSKAVAAVLSVGIRPCSGALIVLVFCFAQGFYVLGILAVLAIAMGTALTTMAVALTVVGSGSLIERLSGSARMGRVAQVLQFVGGLVIVAFGTSLFAGTLVRMGLFA